MTKHSRPALLKFILPCINNLQDALPNNSPMAIQLRTLPPFNSHQKGGKKRIRIKYQRNLHKTSTTKRGERKKVVTCHKVSFPQRKNCRREEEYHEVCSQKVNKVQSFHHFIFSFSEYQDSTLKKKKKGSWRRLQAPHLPRPKYNNSWFSTNPWRANSNLFLQDKW